MSFLLKLIAVLILNHVNLINFHFMNGFFVFGLFCFEIGSPKLALVLDGAGGSNDTNRLLDTNAFIRRVCFVESAFIVINCKEDICNNI